MHLKVMFKPGFDWRHVTWSRPDSRQPSLCSYCSGALPEVPLTLWRENGSAASFCDECLEQWVVNEVA